MEQQNTVKKVILQPITGHYNKSISISIEDNPKTISEYVNLKDYKYFYFVTIQEYLEYNKEKVEVFNIEIDKIDKSPNYFVDAYIENIEDLKVKNDDIVNKMEGLNWDKIVRGVNKKWTCRFTDNDFLITSAGDIINE